MSKTDVAVHDPLSKLVKDAVTAALNESGRPLRNRLMNKELAAEYLGVSGDAVKRLHALGKLPSVSLFAGKMMFDVRDLDAVIEGLKS